MSDFNDRVIAEFRENDGAVGGPFQGSKMAILTTTGARTGLQRIAPMVYFDDPEGILIVASKAGAPDHPAWYANLVANPRVSVELGTDRGIEAFDALAEPLEEARRDEAFARIAASSPGFGAYQEKTDRVIPVIALTRIDA